MMKSFSLQWKRSFAAGAAISSLAIAAACSFQSGASATSTVAASSSAPSTTTSATSSFKVTGATTSAKTSFRIPGGGSSMGMNAGMSAGMSGMSVSGSVAGGAYEYPREYLTTSSLNLDPGYAGSTSDDGDREYATTYCTSMVEFLNTADQIQSQLEGNGQVTALRNMAASFSASIGRAKQALLDAEPPSFDGGNELVARMDKSLEQAITTLDTAQDQLANVPADAVGSLDNPDPNSTKIASVGMTIAVVPLTLVLGYFDAEATAAYKSRVGRELTEQEVWDQSPGAEAFVDQISTIPECAPLQKYSVNGG